MKNSKSFIPGYVIGGSIFLIIIPLILYFCSQKFDPYFDSSLIENPFIRLALSIIGLVIGFIFSFWSLYVQRTIGKGGPAEAAGIIKLSPKTKFLNTTGPYRYTRNPMLFGTCVMYFSLSLLLNSPAVFFIVLLFTVIMIYLVKNTEEKRLLADFGKKYEAYRKRTSLFIPFLPSSSDNL